MQAIQIDHVGGPEVMKLVDIELPPPKPGDVRVRHAACGVNYIDTYHRSGLYKIALPAVLGTEGAGTVEAIGEGVEGLAIGNRVAYAARDVGSYAEARNVSAQVVVRIPDEIDFARAAAMLLKGLTVQYLLRQTRAELAPGTQILWHAAAGGVGLIACQWAAALGLEVIATAGSREKCELALAHGATHAINYREEDVVARVQAITGGRGVPVVYDSVGKDTWERSVGAVSPLGLLVSFGNASGAVPPVMLTSLSPKSIYVQRPTLGAYTTSRAKTQAMADELFDHVAAGRIRIDAPRTYALGEAERAHRDLESRATTGASVLLPG